MELNLKRGLAYRDSPGSSGRQDSGKNKDDKVLFEQHDDGEEGLLIC